MRTRFAYSPNASKSAAQIQKMTFFLHRSNFKKANFRQNVFCFWKQFWNVCFLKTLSNSSFFRIDSSAKQFWLFRISCLARRPSGVMEHNDKNNNLSFPMFLNSSLCSDGVGLESCKRMVSVTLRCFVVLKQLSSMVATNKKDWTLDNNSGLLRIFFNGIENSLTRNYCSLLRSPMERGMLWAAHQIWRGLQGMRLPWSRPSLKEQTTEKHHQAWTPDNKVFFFLSTSKIIDCPSPPLVSL